MADTHYEVDESLKPARDLMDAMRALQAAWDKLALVRGVMIRRRDEADGSQDAHYANHAAAYGYDTSAVARLSFNEIDGNWNTVDAKIRQMCQSHL